MSWDKEFSTLERGLASSTSHKVDHPGQSTQQQPADNELARVAGLLLDNVKDEMNPKFQNSQFMGLMKQLRDGDVTVEGNQIVENRGQSTASDNAPQVDMKGKGRATDFSSDQDPRFRTIAGTGFRDFITSPTNSLDETLQTNSLDEELINYEDENDAYFRQENAEYTAYWKDEDAANIPTAYTANPDVKSWNQLQNDWDKFEATASGIQLVNSYQFQDHNPYLVGDSSLTRHHAMYSQTIGIEEVRPR